ncbi:hypothetical protein Naga_100317g5, partial [Nannochloropsis gaditana]
REGGAWDLDPERFECLSAAEVKEVQRALKITKAQVVLAYECLKLLQRPSLLLLPPASPTGPLLVLGSSGGKRAGGREGGRAEGRERGRAAPVLPPDGEAPAGQGNRRRLRGEKGRAACLPGREIQGTSGGAGGGMSEGRGVGGGKRGSGGGRVREDFGKTEAGTRDMIEWKREMSKEM